MRLGERLDALERRYLAFHQRWAAKLFQICVSLLVLNISAFFFAVCFVPTVAHIFACNVVMFLIGVVANYFLAIQPKESNRTK